MAALTTAEGAELSLGINRVRVGKCEPLGFRLDGARDYAHPNDPEEVDVTILVRTPAGSTLQMPAFFGQPCLRRRASSDRKPVDWIYPASEPRWQGRFAPTEPGVYEAVARLVDRSGEQFSNPVQFACLDAPARGFLRVSQTDPRFLEDSEGRPFFAIGQNLAYIGPTQYMTLARAEDTMDSLAKNGVNYLRVWVCCEDWATAIEARKSAWGKTWEWKPPWGEMPDDPQKQCVVLSGKPGDEVRTAPTTPVAVRPLTSYTLRARIRTDGQSAVSIRIGQVKVGDSVVVATADWQKVVREFNTRREQWSLEPLSFRLDKPGKAWVDAISLRESAGGPELLGEADVNRPSRGVYHTIDSFMVDELVEAARGRGIRLQLCLITRNLYMDALKDPSSAEYAGAIRDARKLLRYAVARWGYSTSVAAWEYFNEIDPGLPTERFYRELAESLDKCDPWRHLRTTSAWSASPKDWSRQELDLAQLHHYLRPELGDRWKDEVSEVLAQTRLMRDNASQKPILLAEFGLADDKWGQSPRMKEDTELVHFHNSLWASATSGAAGTAMFWWWDELDRMNAYRHYRPLAIWVADIPWTTASLRPLEAEASGTKVRLLGMQGKGIAFGWVVRPEAAWWNLVVDRVRLEPVADVRITIRNVQLPRCRVQWWDTREGRLIRENIVAAENGVIEITPPAFTRDVAFKVRAE